MEKSYRFKQDEIEKICSRFGTNFYEKVLRNLAVYAEKWTLTSFQLIPSYSANVVFTCDSECFGKAVLKIGNPSFGAVVTEYNTLCQYNGKRFCKAFEADPENGVILEECVQPGTPLRDECSLADRLAVFCSLYKDLHIAPANAENYPTYTGWVGRITEYMSKRQDCKPLYGYMKKAEEICLSVSSSYRQKMLLHGDFHHDNILLGPHGEYKLIDPKGVIGDPVFDVPRFLLNEFGDEVTPDLYKKITDIINILQRSLNIPSDILKQCLYVETAMGVCWSVEGGSTPEEYPSLIQTVAFAEAIMKG
ncbi:aminoglycoside resistance protein [Paenibacillus mesophilus]|uniref:aminoglycoside phosphotransferase family protein n=1 Tax=Paenibacillus mesophilus TaxID=2582849 RepID=UPI00110D4409|nr:aminoglycoside phosphotransferase family protein [Paenibacillus mesophilus]TMV46282.1 aminoglycoside resistance protein [Paenibacillus mesophilus]